MAVEKRKEKKKGGGTHQVVQDLLPDDLHHLERGQRRHRVYEHVAMDADEVLRVQDAVLILSRGVSSHPVSVSRPSYLELRQHR